MLTAELSKSTSKTQPTVYSYKDVLENSINYFNGDELAASTWMNKYAMKDKSGKFLEKSPDDMHRRMSK